MVYVKLANKKKQSLIAILRNTDPVSRGLTSKWPNLAPVADSMDKGNAVARLKMANNALTSAISTYHELLI